METITADQYASEIDSPSTIEYGEEVREKLGYGQLAIRQKRLSTVSSLLSVLREHNIPFYRPSDVKEYQNKMVKKVRRKNHVSGGIALAFLAFLAPAIVLTTINSINPIIGFSIVAVSGAGFMIAIGRWLWRTDGNDFEGRWLNSPLDRYQEEIPIEAIQKAMNLRKVAPNVGFEVEYFEVTENRNPVPVYDPLLYACLDNARFCIAKWDEPKFTAELTK